MGTEILHELDDDAAEEGTRELDASFRISEDNVDAVEVRKAS
jgi:hypothetical protein